MSAFALSNLFVNSYVNGWTNFYYMTSNPLETLEPGFFNNAAEMLSSGDMMTIPHPEWGMIRFVNVEDGVVTLRVPA